ncbi:endonuclease/exonuclease/phosphatase family protein [Lentzea sp. NPDC092896]|uniref:endonuclease/exonuclease/phosphatase family protein n=1 Tax=Lentzea sp. NPDC092896 TaxID=3364127 RepID=UPI0037FD3D68
MTEVVERRRSRLLARLVIGLVAAWAVFVLLHEIFDGRWWFWLVPTMAPPLVLVVVPLLLLVAVLLIRAGRVALLVVVATLVVCADQSGLNPAAVLPSPAAPADGVRVFTWNTQYWDQKDDPAHFYEFLKRQNADVYLLQEHIHSYDGVITPTDQEARIRQEFPGYHVVVRGELVTLSRFPVVSVPPIDVDEGMEHAAELMRVDVLTPRGPLTLYNVHILVQMDPRSPLTSEFYRFFRERSAGRRMQFDQLTGDIGNNPAPSLVAGDFNTSPIMGDIDRMRAVATDAIGANRSLYPVSWNAESGLRFWRLDWVFTRRLKVHTYEFTDPEGMSDHYAQSLVMTVE